MLCEVEYCKKTLVKNFNKPIEITEDQEMEFLRSSTCHICGKGYNKYDVRVRDHCHVTGKYRGSAHQS